MESPPTAKLPNTRLIFGILLILVCVAVVFWLAGREGSGRSADNVQREKLGVMSSLPLFWAEGKLSGSAQNEGRLSPTIKRLSASFQLVPLDSWKDLEKQKLDRILLVQPRAFTPKELEQIDIWVRAGGRAVILADPALRWESSYPLGDKRRPLFTSMLSPLFTHWGLELALPLDDSGKTSRHGIDGHFIVTSAAGIWEQRKLDGNCEISNEGLLARCRIGSGSATLLADADLVDPEFWHGTPGLIGNGDIADNMSWLISEIENMKDGG